MLALAESSPSALWFSSPSCLPAHPQEKKNEPNHLKLSSKIRKTNQVLGFKLQELNQPQAPMRLVNQSFKLKRFGLTKPSKTQLRLYGIGVCHDETNLYSPVFELKESVELQGHSCSQRQPGSSIDCHFQGHTVLGVIIDYPVKYDTLVVNCKLCKLVDGNQISQTSISVDIKVVELHIWCEVLV